MLLKIKLIKSTSMFCIESAAATVATWLGRNYEMIFSNMWGFKFNNENTISNNVIGTGISKDYNEKDLFWLFKKYHGIEFKFNDFKKTSSITDIVIKELEYGMPILVFPENKYCPWLGQSNYNEQLLIVGYDNENFICLDIHNNLKDNQFLPIENLFLSYDNSLNAKTYATFRVVSNEQINIGLSDVLSYIKHSDSLNRNPFDEMELLADCVEQMLDYENEKIGSDRPILENIKQICRARKLISSTFSYIAQKNNDELAQNYNIEFYTIGGEWNIVWSMLLKAYYEKNIDKEKYNFNIAKRIREIAYKECKLIKGIVNNHSNDFELINLSEKNNNIIKKENIIPFNLKKNLNSIIFDNTELRASIKEQIKISGIPFEISTDKSDNDNVMCCEQIIDINQGIYKRILLLGCSFWGDQFGYLDVIYTDNHIDKLYIDFPDWYYNAISNVPIIWAGDIVKGNNETKSLFCLSFSIQYKQNIKRIKLPDNPDIRILSIAFEKDDL